jgi:hypothetical protein
MPPSSIPPPWGDDYVQILHGLKDIPGLARDHAKDLRTHFPVDGRPWIYEGSPDNAGTIHLVLTSAWQLDRRLHPLHPLRDPDQDDPLGRHDNLRHVLAALVKKEPEEIKGYARRSRMEQEEIKRYGKRFKIDEKLIAAMIDDPDDPQQTSAMCHIPPELWTALAGLITCFDRLLRHYQWRRYLDAKTQENLPWRCPAVPVVPSQAMEAFELAADILGKEIARAEQVLQKVADPPPPPPPPPEPRLQVRGPAVLLDGQPVPLDMGEEARAAALCLLKHLLAAGGEWRSSTELDEMEKKGPCTDHVGTRWDLVRKKLPPSLLNLTETNRRKGVRLRPGALRR